MIKKSLLHALDPVQMIEDIRLAMECKKPAYLCNRVGGMIPSPEEVLESIKKAAGGKE